MIYDPIVSEACVYSRKITLLNKEVMINYSNQKP